MSNEQARVDETVDSSDGQSLSTLTKVRNWLAHEKVPLIAAFLALLLTLPSLRVGFEADDYFHKLCLDPPPQFSKVCPSPWRLFMFFDGNEERTRQMMNMGVLPWWTNLKAKAHFHRPLTVLTHFVDHALWPNSALLVHLHNIFWYVLAVFVVALLFQELFHKKWLSGAAALCYAVDDAHGWAAAWTANRNVLVCTFFGCLSVLAYVKWRRDGWTKGKYLTPLLLLAALLAKEAGAAVVVLIVAYELFLTDSIKLRAPLASCLTFVLWLLYYKLSGYGVAHIGLYVDPAGTPLLFLKTMLVRIPVLLMGMWTGPAAELSIALGPIVGRYYLFASFFVLFWLAFLFVPLLRHSTEAKFFAFTMLFSLIPSCATFPADRLLFFAGIGGFGLLVLFLAGLIESHDWLPESRFWRLTAKVSAIILFVIHVVFAPLLFMFRTAFPFGPPEMAKFYVKVPEKTSLTGKKVIILNSPSVMHTMYFSIRRAVAKESLPEASWTLSTGVPHIGIKRVDGKTLAIRPAIGFLQIWFDRLVRSDRAPFNVGDVINLHGLTITVKEMNSRNRPALVHFQFAKELEHESYMWLAWNGEKYIRYELPTLGKEVQLETPLSMPISKDMLPVFLGVPHNEM